MIKGQYILNHDNLNKMTNEGSGVAGLLVPWGYFSLAQCEASDVQRLGLGRLQTGQPPFALAGLRSVGKYLALPFSSPLSRV